MSQKKRIAFIFLDEIHHLYHFISVAVELSKTNSVHILTYPEKHSFLHKTLERLGGENVKVEKLKTQPFRAFTDNLKKRKLPRKGFWLKKNMDYILSFDAVIVTDYIHRYILDAKKEKNNPKIIKFPHGTPGRGYWHNEKLKDFDAQLVLGDFQFQQLKELGLLGDYPMKVGYVKLDVINTEKKISLFKNKKPVVLYNPHFDSNFSSWQEMGLKVLEFFYNQNQFNLLFAPHLHLFDTLKGGENKDIIPKKYFESESIFIDLGSENSVNMTYVNEADIYLGDVSSQVYEFIIHPRPAIFINSKKVNFNDDVDYRFWKCGEVITTIEELKNTLENAETDFKKYESIQKKITSENYYSEAGSTASQRAANAINLFLKTV